MEREFWGIIKWRISERENGVELEYGGFNKKKKAWSVVRKMESKKVVGLDGVSVEVWKVLESLGIRRLTKNFNKVLVEA